MAKRLFDSRRPALPEKASPMTEELLAGDVMPRPYVVKPPAEGSSVGVRIVRERRQRAADSKARPGASARKSWSSDFIPGASSAPR